MSSRSDFFLKKTLGEDFFKSLEKFELWKPGTKTTVDHEEIKTALKIVPRAILAMLIRELTPMKVGDNKDVEIHIQNNLVNLMKVTKHEQDVYSGEIISDNKRIVDFKYRSIPGVGLVIMSAFELYDVSELDKKPSQDIAEDLVGKVQRIIDERMALHHMVGHIVDKKIAQRDMIEQLTEEKIAQMKKPEIIRKGSPLKDFLQKREEKIKKSRGKEYSIEMSKNEHVNCPDCGKKIYDENGFSGCICFGDDMDKKLYITKSEKGVKVRFGKGWDVENIEMLLEVLRRKRG